uniref:Mitochondrial inner membrane protein Mpv17 n=1 Tax=Hirondellea gigas TaxID=1518452 RepID=A0A2P2I5S7_9CRUS
MSALLRAYSSALRRFPTTVQSIQAGSLMAVGDMTSQMLIERRSLQQYEWQRSARFFTLGTVLVGPALRVWYGVLDRKFGSLGRAAALKKVFFDQAFFAPSFLVVFLGSLGLMQGKTANEVQKQIKKDYIDIVIAGWMVWPAVQVCNFSFVPLHHQVLVVQTFALFWNTYLAWKINREDNVTENETQSQQPER